MKSRTFLSSKQTIIEKICDQVSNLSDIRLLLMNPLTPPKELRNRVITALMAYVDQEGKPIVREDAPRLADEIIESRQFDLNNVLVRADKHKPFKPYKGPKLRSGQAAEAREATKEDFEQDALVPTFNTPAPDEVHIMEPDEKLA